MRLPRPRLLAASATVLVMSLGVPAVMATTASAATSARSAVIQAQAKQGTLTAPVTGTFTNAAGTGHFTGTFAPTTFRVVNGVLEATGLLTGTLTSANGTSLGSVSQSVTLPVVTPSSAGSAAAAAPAAASCNVLDLVLGPLNLNLLGLVVTLNQVHLNITAVPGELLGTLLCDVAGLLNGGGPLSSIVSLLNQILAAL
jgi:hypothetical protein